MANNKSSKTKKEEKRQTYILLISLVVVVSMLFSGIIYFGSDSGAPQQQAPQEEEPAYSGFSMLPLVANSSIYVQVLRLQPELIAVPQALCLSNKEIGWVHNISATGLRAVSMEVANPFRNQNKDLCGSFLFFRFGLDNLTAESADEVKQGLENRIGTHLLKRSYVGLLPVNISGPDTDKVVVLGSLDIQEGEIAEILLFQKSEDGSVFALERARIPIGPPFKAKVLEQTDVLVSGVADKDFDLGLLGQGINASDLRLNLPSYLVNDSLDNMTLDGLSALGGIPEKQADNSTKISYNSSGQRLGEFLEARNITYSSLNGSVSLLLPLNASMDAAFEALNETNAKEIEVSKTGYVEIAGTVIMNSRVVEVADAKRLSAAMDYDSEAGDEINVSLSAFSFGDQVYVFGAQEI